MDLTNLTFLEYIGKKKRPVILSTGMGSMKEIKAAVKPLKKQEIKILQFYIAYLCTLHHLNLLT